MSESSSYSSLLALVDSHLSKVNLQSRNLEADTTEDGTNAMLSNIGFGSKAGKRLAIPSFNLSGNPLGNVLSEQISNMLKAKERKEEQQQKLSEEMVAEHLSNDHETDNVIDLMEALRTSYKTAIKCSSAHSSTESLFEPTFIEFDEKYNCENHQLTPTLLACHTDLSHILDSKVLQAKCSTFGKILVSRLRPFSLPYKRKISSSSVKKFDFKSKSPCDILKEKTSYRS